MLSDAKLRNLKPGPRAYKVMDRDGLYAMVLASGVISFRYNYAINGRQETLVIGRYGSDALSLAEAREKLMAARKLVAEGLSPTQHKRRQKQRREGEESFSEWAERWMTNYKMAESTRDMRRSVYERDLARPFGKAVSLSGRSTDEAVCDLSPSTSYNLTKNVLFVEAGTLDEAEIYTRIALRFITSRCRDGQVLIMHSDFGDPLDDRFFRDVSAQVCSASKVQRESTSTTEAPQSFQIKCPISKLRDAASYLSAIEREKPTEAKIAEGAPSHRPDSGNDSQPKRDCKGSLSFGQVVLGMGGKCSD